MRIRLTFLVALICIGMNTTIARTLNIPSVYANPKAASEVAQNGDTVLIE